MLSVCHSIPTEYQYEHKISSTTTMSMSSNGGGILRSTKQKNKPVVGGRGVTFSSARNKDDDDDDTPPSSRRLAPAGDDEYDSDEVEDAIMASGDGLSMMDRNESSSDNLDNDPVLLGSLGIEEAKRKRGRVRRNEDFLGDARSDNADDIIDDDPTNNNHHGEEDPSLSLITDHEANPETYESNAGGNASCPVEPFNMNAEEEGGMGYFDGDTYVFRQNMKPVDGEEDAWLDGFKGDDDDENEEETKGGGGLDSTAVWKPSGDAKKTNTNNNTKQKDKFKFIDENATPVDIGRRLATLLQSDDETVMKALTRHGSQLREMQSKEQKLKKSKLLRKRKSKSKETTDNNFSDAADGDEIKSTTSLQIDQTRRVVEELTELADALLFGGEADAYDLTKADWIHRYKLEVQFPSSSIRKIPTDNTDERLEAKKQRRGYFDDTTTNSDANGESTNQSEPIQPRHDDQVMWEYKGNEDGAIHGPYTSKQMMEWTSCGYFVGDSAVDIRRVGTITNDFATTPRTLSSEDSKEKKAEETTPIKTDVDDLMADLESDGEDNDDGGDKESATVNAESSWMRSDRVDFSLFL